MSQLLQDLLATRSNIAKPEWWVKGRMIHYRHSGPCYCLAGAARRVVSNKANVIPTGDDLKRVEAVAKAIIPEQLHYRGEAALIRVNDRLNIKHSAVIKLLNDAIRKERANERAKQF